MKDLFVKINKNVEIEKSFKAIEKILELCIEEDISFNYYYSALCCIYLTTHYRGKISLRSFPLFKGCIEYCLNHLQDSREIKAIAKYAYHLEDDSALFYLEDKGFEFNFKFEDDYLEKYDNISIFSTLCTENVKPSCDKEIKLNEYYAKMDEETRLLLKAEKKRVNDEKEVERSAKRIREKEAKKTKKRSSERRLRYKRNAENVKEKERQMVKDAVECVQFEQLLDRECTLEKIMKDKEFQKTLIRRVKGGCYYFQCNANALLDINLVSRLLRLAKHNIDCRFSEIAPKKVNKYIKDARLHVESLEAEMYNIESKAFFSKYKIPQSIWNLYKFDEDDNMLFSFIFTNIESEMILKKLFGKDNDFDLPSLYNCNMCNYHINDKRKYDNHRVTKSCQIKRGIIKPKEGAIYHCDTCDYTTGIKQAYEKHRLSNGCMEARGLTPIKKTKKKPVYIQCDLCPESPPLLEGYYYNRHRNMSKRCLKRQKEALEE